MKMPPYSPWPKPINRDSLQDGDHVLAYQYWGLLSHQGIYVAKERKVIHFDWRNHWYSETGKDYNPCGKCGSSNYRVRKSCVNCFLRYKALLPYEENGSDDEVTKPALYRYEYGKSLAYVLTHDAGTCSTRQSDEADEVVRRAMDMFGKHTYEGRWTSHWRLWNNCESFAFYCKTGQSNFGKQFLRLVTIVALFMFVALAFELQRARSSFSQKASS